MTDAAKRAYEFSHDVGTASWEVESPAILLRVTHPDAGPALVEEASQDRLVLREIDAGLAARYDFFPYTIAGRIELSRESAIIPLEFEFSSPVTMVSEPDGIIRALDLQGREVLSIIPSRPTDDTGMAGPATELSIIGGGTTWQLYVVTDGEWMRDESRVLPIRIPLDISFSPPSGVGFAAIRAMSLEDETILYRDTRPDAATQFHITLFDDPDFRREKQQYRGNPACGTVPLGVGDTRDLTSADLQRHEDGLGYESRTVWIRLIASKPIAANQAVMYDVWTPGLTDYVGQVAERVGSMGELPIYRGSFVISEESPPSSVDGVGWIDAHISEHRTNDLEVRLTVLGRGTSDLPASIIVAGTRGSLNLGCSIVVYNPPTLWCSIIVTAGAAGGHGVSSIPVTVTVDQPMDEDFGYVYDPCIDMEGTWATWWSTADDDEEHVPAARVTDYTHEPPYSIGSVIGSTIEPEDRTHYFRLFETDPDEFWPQQISHRARTSNTLIASLDVPDVCFAFWYKHVLLPAPPGTEWHSMPRHLTHRDGDDWGDGYNAFIICDTIFEDDPGKIARQRIISSQFWAEDFFAAGDPTYDYSYTERMKLAWGSYDEDYYTYVDGGGGVKTWQPGRFDWPKTWTRLSWYGMDTSTIRLTKIELHFSGALCYTKSLTYPYEVSEHPRPSSLIYVDHIRLYRGLIFS